MSILKEIIYSTVVITVALASVLAISLNSLMQRYTKSSYSSDISQVSRDFQITRSRNLKMVSGYQIYQIITFVSHMQSKEKYRTSILVNYCLHLIIKCLFRV